MTENFGKGYGVFRTLETEEQLTMILNDAKSHASLADDTAETRAELNKLAAKIYRCRSTNAIEWLIRGYLTDPHVEPKRLANAVLPYSANQLAFYDTILSLGGDLDRIHLACAKVLMLDETAAKLSAWIDGRAKRSAVRDGTVASVLGKVKVFFTKCKKH